MSPTNNCPELEIPTECLYCGSSELVVDDVTGWALDCLGCAMSDDDSHGGRRHVDDE